jgi:hypothetical protein
MGFFPMAAVNIGNQKAPVFALSYVLFYNDHTTTDMNVKTAFRIAYVLSQGSH